MSIGSLGERESEGGCCSGWVLLGHFVSVGFRSCLDASKDEDIDLCGNEFKFE